MFQFSPLNRASPNSLTDTGAGLKYLFGGITMVDVVASLDGTDGNLTTPFKLPLSILLLTVVIKITNQ